MIERRAAMCVERALRRQAAVALIGPRQVGKTTLAWSVTRDSGALYLDLESAADRRKLSEPELLFARNQERLVILDEIHRVPELFGTLRGVIDEGRRQGRGTGRFLVLGSAGIDLLRQSGESLAGRIEYVHLRPFDALEVAEEEAGPYRLWVRGGFPDSFLAASDEDSLAWRTSFVRTYLELDVPQFGPRIPAETLRRLWTMLAHEQGARLNAARLAGSLSISAKSVTRYVDLLVDLLLVRRLSPLHANVGKRLVKSPRVYVRDSGLVHALLGLGDYETLVGHPVVGASWEGFVIENLLSVAPERSLASYYRTAAGAEIDLVLDLPGGRGRWAIEIKRGLAPRLDRGFHHAREDLQPDRCFLVYSGEERYPLGQGVEAIGLSTLVSMVAGV